MTRLFPLRMHFSVFFHCFGVRSFQTLFITTVNSIEIEFTKFVKDSKVQIRMQDMFYTSNIIYNATSFFDFYFTPDFSRLIFSFISYFFLACRQMNVHLFWCLWMIVLPYKCSPSVWLDILLLLKHDTYFWQGIRWF